MKIEIEFNDSAIKEMEDAITLLNLINKYKNIEKTHTIEDFVRGAVHEKIKHLNNYDKLFIEASGIQNPKTHNFNIKNRFKEIAKSKGITQTFISEQGNINKTNLSQAFNNIYQPRMDLFFRIWIILGCPPIHECIYVEED